MTTTAVIYLHDPQLDKYAARAESPSSVLLAMAGILSSYAQRQTDGDAATAWQRGAVNLPFVSPIWPFPQTRTVVDANTAALANRALTETVTRFAADIDRGVADLKLLAPLSTKVAAALAGCLHQDGRASLLVALLAAADRAGQAPAVKISLASFVTTPEPVHPGSLTTTEDIASYAFNYDRFTNRETDMRSWRDFAYQVPKDDVTRSDKFLSLALAAPVCA